MTCKRVRAEVKRSRSFRGFAELSQAHWVILENAKAKHDGWLYECWRPTSWRHSRWRRTSTTLDRCFLPIGRKPSRKLSKRKKLERILSQIGLVKAPNDHRFGTLDAVFEIRDVVAHARTEELSEPPTVEEGHIEELRRRKPLTKWEKLSTIEFATRTRSRIPSH